MRAELAAAGLYLPVGLLPVLTFLVVLILLDSYKLIALRRVALLLVAGALAAMGSLVVNRSLVRVLELDAATLARYAAPLVEETFKGSVVVALMLRKRVGFLVDASICGFAVGAGFAAVENMHYFANLERATLLVWLLRGFGTAVMHGGVTAILAITAKELSDRGGGPRLVAFLPGFMLAVALHSVFNHFFLAPDLSTLLLLTGLSALFVLVFRSSEARTRDWLGTGWDTDAELLEMIHSGQVVSASRIGSYLTSLTDRFPGQVVADMLCLLRLRLELSIRAKGILLMQKAGFTVPPRTDVEAQFAELEYLEKSIGPTGLLALKPIFHMTDRDLWQYHMITRR